MRVAHLLWVLSFTLRTLLWTATAGIVLAGSVLYHLQLPIARGIARELTMRFVNGEIRGELVIGRIEELTLDHITARYAQLFDGEGRRIITADRVELVPDFMQLRRGLLRFVDARAYGSVVRLVNNAEGDPSLFTTFDARHPSPPGTPPGAKLHALVDRLQLFDATLYGQVIELQGLRAEHVDALGRLSIGETVEIELVRAHGQVVRPFDFVGEIASLNGTISTDKLRGTKLNVVGQRGEEEVRVELSYRSAAANELQELDLDLHTDKLSPDTLRRVGYTFAGPLAPMLKGRVQLTGPPNRLALSADVESEAGNAEVSGVIGGEPSVSVHITSDDIAVDKLVPDAPSVHVKGLLHIAVGSEPDAKPEVHAEISALRYRGVLVPAFVLDGELEDNGIRIDRAKASRGGQISLRGHVGFDGHTDLVVDAHFAALERDPNLSRIAPNLEGTLTTSLRVRTPAKDKPTKLDIQGKVALEDARYGSLSAKHVTLVGTARGDPDLPQLDVEVRGEAFQLLSYNLGQAHFTLRGGPRDYSARGEFEVQGQKTFNFDSAITADREGFVVQADPIEFTVGSESWRGAIHDLRVQHEHSVELGFLRLASRAQRLEAKGIVRVAGEDSLHADLQNFDVTALRAVLGERFPLAHGYADANLELRGDVDTPEVSLTGALREGKWNPLTKFDALYTLSYSHGHLEFDSDLDMEQHGTLQLSGQGELDAGIADPQLALRSGLYNLTLSGTRVDITLVPWLRDRVHAGFMNGQLEAQGGLDSATFSGQITTSELRAGDWSAFDLVTRFNYDHNLLSTRLQARDKQGVFGRARVDWNVDWRSLNTDPRSYAPALLAADFDVRGQSLDRGLDELPFGISWPVRANSTFKLTRRAGEVQGDLQATLQPKQVVADASCQLKTEPSLQMRWQLQNRRASVQLDGQLDGQNIAHGGGEVAWEFDTFLRGEAPATPLDASLSGKLDLPQVERVPGLCRRGRGPLQAEWDVRGLGTDAPTALLSVHGEIIPQAPAANSVSMQPLKRCLDEPLQIEAKLDADSQRASLEAGARGCKGGSSKLLASVPLTWNHQHAQPARDTKRDTQLELTLDDAELEPVLDYLPGVRGFSALGTGHLTVRTRGTNLDARGQIALSHGRLYAITTGQELSAVELVMSANGNWLKLDDVRARVGRGSLEAAGGISFEGLYPRRFQLGVVTRDLPIQREGIDLAWLTGSAAVIGEITDKHSHTAVKLHSLAVRLPNVSSRSPQSLDPHPDITLTTEAPKRETEAPYSFEFAIDGRDQLTAKRNDFEAALAAELALEYREPDLYVGGYIEFRRGTFELFGKRFELNRGSMRFDGSTELNPEVSLVATHEPDVAGGSTVIANVSGTLAKPDVSFYAERCPGEGAVVLLLSGRCPSEEDSASSNPGATQEALAAGIIGGILTLGAQRQLSGLIPTLAVESSARGTRTRVKAGFEAVPPFMRNLVQRVYLQGAISTADQSANASSAAAATPDFLLELYFPNNIVGAGRVAPTTHSWGLDVTWEP